MNKRERNWQNRVKKTFALSGRFCSHIMNNMAQNNNRHNIINFIQHSIENILFNGGVVKFSIVSLTMSIVKENDVIFFE